MWYAGLPHYLYKKRRGILAYHVACIESDVVGQNILPTKSFSERYHVTCIESDVVCSIYHVAFLGSDMVSVVFHPACSAGV
ncbi:hypothetical protein TorRG33x02_182420, partial [Trema orientale]